MAARSRQALLLGAVAAVVAPVLASCDVSRVPAAADVHVTGRALDAAGRPLAGARIQLFKEPDLGEAVFGAVFVIGSLGSACFLPVAPSICRSARTTTAGADGTFSYTVPASDTQGSIGQASTLDAVVSDPGGGGRGATTTLRFEAQSTQVSLPDARLWDAAPRFAQPAGRFHLDWEGLPPADGRDVAYSVDLDDSQDRSVWTQPANGTAADVDARVVEDVRTTAAAIAKANLGATGEVQAVYSSRRVDVAPTAGAPPSRSRPCLAVTAVTLATTPQRTCGVTDGDLFDPARLQGNGSGVASGVVVDLGSVRPVGLVVARALGGEYAVETSTDGTTYVMRATGSGLVDALDVQGFRARYLRVRSTGGVDESLMDEVSVW